jgi:hypothetical protein
LVFLDPLHSSSLQKTQPHLGSTRARKIEKDLSNLEHDSGGINSPPNLNLITSFRFPARYRRKIETVVSFDPGLRRFSYLRLADSRTVGGNKK